MRPKRVITFLFLLVVGSSSGQQFNISKGLELFSRGQYHVAIDSMMKWADTFASERGLAYYYIGESYYNLGLDETVLVKAIPYFNEGIGYFKRALNETDIIIRYKSKIRESKYKIAWCYYRIAELEKDPLANLKLAYNNFFDLASTEEDSLSVNALYMAGDVSFRMALWQHMLILFYTNEAQAEELIREAIRNLKESDSIFKRVIISENVSIHLITSAQIKIQEIKYELGKIYEKMSQIIFTRIKDSRKERTPEETAKKMFLLIDYKTVLHSLDRVVKDQFESVIVYSQAVKYLNLYLLTGEYEYKLRLNSFLDSLRWSEFRDEKFFIQANRDQRIDSKNEQFYKLANSKTSFYTKAIKSFPEARYWLALVQFVANDKESEDQFNRFLIDTESISDNPRITFLREDSWYRIFLLRFDRPGVNKRYLRKLRDDIENFRSKVPFIQDRIKLLLQLVRIRLAEEPIWGQILESVSIEDKLKEAFILIQNMLVRAARVTGKERVPYLDNLDLLFQITGHRQSLETNFYKGLSLFLRAEIQETPRDKRLLYFSAADTLGSVGGDYKYEAMYVQARSYFASAKHEPKPEVRRKVYEKAKPIFIRLINEARSLRSVYYLGEIFRIDGKDMAARRCYDVVMKLTKDEEGGDFWYNNALAGKQNCREVSDYTNELEGININDVLFPERLIVIDNVEVSLERFADQEYVRRLYSDQTIDLLLKFGPQKRTIYPSNYRISFSRFGNRSFDDISAGIQERIGSVTSGLQLRVVLPENIYNDPVVSVDGDPIERKEQLFYQKAYLPLNKEIEIRVECDPCYPFVKIHRFTQTGMEQFVVYLVRQLNLVYKGNAVESGINIVSFPERLDRNIVIYSKGQSILSSSLLYKHFESDIGYRDFDFSETMDRYLVVHSEKKNLIVYRNDAMISREGEFQLVFPKEKEELNSPEGIAIDSRGNIYVADWGNHRICVFSQDGTYLDSFGSFRSGVSPGINKQTRLIFPTRIAIAEDSDGILIEGKRVYREPLIFVADRNGVHLLDVRGNYLDSFSLSGTAKGSIYGLAVQGYGSKVRLYVENRESGNIVKFMAN